MDSIELIYHIINSKHGWSVAEQFNSTYRYGQPLEQQNSNALRYILGLVEEILNLDALSEHVSLDLKEYKEEIKEYLLY